MNNTEIRNSFHKLLELAAEPVAVTFCDQLPAGVPRLSPAAPAGCAYWKSAAEGAAFYTAAADHLNCPIGAYTHGAEMPSATQAELEGMIRKMVGIEYLKPEEIPNIPRRHEPLRFVLYAPLSKSPADPDLVLIRANARQAMLLAEAGQARNALSTLPVMGRPACSVIPAGLNSGRLELSLGCIGNRVYTGLADGEMYVAIPKARLLETVEALRAIVSANRELESYHRGRAGAVVPN